MVEERNTLGFMNVSLNVAIKDVARSEQRWSDAIHGQTHHHIRLVVRTYGKKIWLIN